MEYRSTIFKIAYYQKQKLYFTYQKKKNKNKIANTPLKELKLQHFKKNCSQRETFVFPTRV